MCSQKIDPLSPDNPILLMTGPLTGTGIASTGRYCIVTVSPLTGSFLQSHSGGQVGPEMRYAGYDGIIISGSSPEPVVLSIDDDHVELIPAEKLWGLTVKRSMREIEASFDPEAKALTIGPAGERLVPMASVQNDVYRACGRGGAGAVFGSKRLKAIVVRGTGGVDVADPEALQRTMAVTREMARKDLNGFSRYGTSNAGIFTNAAGVLPTKNFSRGTYEHMGHIVGSSLKETVWSGRRACFACPIGCSQFSVSDGIRTEGPEYETTFSLGSCVLNHDPKTLVEANELCNDLGLDTMSAGVTIAWAMEASERGIIPEKIAWGDGPAICSLLRKMAYRDGIGAALCNGSKRASEKYGGTEYAIHVRGMELPGYDPRGTQGMALAYATSSRGACHLRAPLYIEEAFTKKSPAATLEGKAPRVVEVEDHMMVLDSLIICRFATRSTLDGSLPNLSALLADVTGDHVEPTEMLKAASRAISLARCINVRQGRGAEHDTLPERFFDEALAGVHIDRNEYRNAVGTYYALRGWDSTGTPTEECLQARP
jgi:aldehyde:ferredoxin oxidoreductase